MKRGERRADGSGKESGPAPRVPAGGQGAGPPPRSVMARPRLFGRLRAAVLGVVHVGALPGERGPGRAGVDAAPRDPLVQRAAQQRPEEVREPRGLRSSGDALSGLRAAELGRAGPGWAELHRPWDSRSSDTWLPRFSPLLYAGPQRAESGPGTTSHRYPSSLWMTSGGSSYG